MNRRLLSSSFVLSLLTTASLLSAGCPGGPLPEFKYAVDPDVKPVENERIGKNGVARPLAAVADEDGTTTSFIANEILIRPSSNQELSSFLARTGGTVIDSDALPASVNGVAIPQQFRTATEYTVRVDASAFPMDNFHDDVTAGLEVGGDARISSDQGARLLALIASEASSGLNVAPNVAYTPSAVYMDRALEQPLDTGGFANMLNYYPHVWDGTGSKAGVAASWAYFAMRETPTRQVRVAIIDGGFYLDGAGMPMLTGPGGVHDFRMPDGATIPLQWDTLDDDGTANGPSSARCSGGSLCNWHGYEAATTATAVINNQFGVAGSGGQVAVPILVKTDLTTGSVKEGLRMAQALGAEIVSMSFGGECDNVFCQFYYTVERYSDAFWAAKRAGMLLLAAAGNNTWDARNTIPCRYNGAVMCVGALNRDDTDTAWYSNFGSNVDIYAPTGIPTYGPNNDGDIVWGDYNGTSAATPYTAGVAALLKSANPSLTPDDLHRILVETGGVDSEDPKVTVYLRAIDALRSLFENRFDEDTLEPNNNQATATVSTVSNPGVRDYGTLSLHSADDADYFLVRVNDWVGAVINVRHASALADLEFTLTRISSGGAPRATGYEYYSNGEVYRFSGLVPGDYIVRIRTRPGTPWIGDRETLYDFRMEFTDEAPPTADAFESNNTFLAPYPLDNTRGTRLANFHTTTDLDHYRFTVGSLLGTETMDFVIRNADTPVTLRVYDTTGAMVLETTSNRVSLGTGTWVVRAHSASGQRGRYSFTAMGATFPSPEESARFSPHPVSYWRIIATLNNLDLSVIRGAEYLLIPAGPRPKNFVILGAVDVQLMDRDGNLLREGVQIPNGQGGFTTTLNTEGFVSTPELLIRVSPTGFDA
ncbi:MAG: S8/S53 family peptidase, partial [Bdellovibrionales bacterium]|nr:S8/S53 family peptidase [Bdellovibrionales bacterium]